VDVEVLATADHGVKTVTVTSTVLVVASRFVHVDRDVRVEW
jgi:hypothetical protein